MNPIIVEYIVKIFLSYGLYHMIINVAIPSSYIKLLLFLFMKIILDYKKCTITTLLYYLSVLLLQTYNNIAKQAYGVYTLVAQIKRRSNAENR